MHDADLRPAAGARLAARHYAGLAVGLLALAVLMAVPPPAPITQVGMARLGLLAFAVIWWTATPLPLSLTTLAMLGLGIATGSLSVAEAFAHSSTWVLWFVIGSFGLAAALETTGVNRRIALAFLDVPWARGRPHRFLLMFLLSATAASAVMANTVVAVIWLSLAVKIYEMLRISHTDPLVEANTLGVAWAANIGGIATPVGNGTNAPAMALIASATGVHLTFAQWTAIGTPLALLLILTAALLFRATVPAGAPSFQSSETVRYIAEERRRLGPMPSSERRAIAWFAAAILLWVLPDLSTYVAPATASAFLQRNLHLTVPALLIPIAMCLTPAGGGSRRFVLTWEEWVKGVDWGLVIFIGGVMGLGTAIGTEDTGIPAFAKAALSPSLGQLSEYTFVLLLSVGVMLVTSLISNMVTLAIFVPLGISIAQGLQIADPVAVGVILGIGPSLDYMLPSGTTTNAIVAGSGYLRVATMIRHGALLFIMHTLLLTFVGYPLAKWVVSWSS
jgi:solute carrier family 13 (sodium-dependent dicarboxylate transporter), member 2/3/5